MGWGEGEAVGGVERQRGRRRIGHGMSKGVVCLDISSSVSSVLSWSGDNAATLSLRQRWVGVGLKMVNLV